MNLLREWVIRAHSCLLMAQNSERFNHLKVSEQKAIFDAEQMLREAFQCQSDPGNIRRQRLEKEDSCTGK